MKFVGTEHLVQQCTEHGEVLVADLHEDAAGVGQQFLRDDQAVTQIGEV